MFSNCIPWKCQLQGTESKYLREDKVQGYSQRAIIFRHQYMNLNKDIPQLTFVCTTKMTQRKGTPMDLMTK